MLEALGFLTPLPVGGRRVPSGRTFLWFPLVGALLGGVLGLLWRFMGAHLPDGVSAALMVAFDLGLTGMLHFDGLVDSADGLLSQLPRARRLEVMSAPDVGAFGVAVGGATMLLRFACFQQPPRILLLVGLWCASRTTMAIVAAAMPYARSVDGGLATPFLDGMPNPVILGAAGLALSLVAAWAWAPVQGPVSVVAGVVAAVGVAWSAERRLGGFTGDVLGACGVVCETVGLLVAVTRWA